MRSSRLLFSCVHLTVTLFIIALGCCLMIIPYSKGFQSTFSNLLSMRPAFLLSLGVVVVGLGTFLMLCFYFMHNKRYFKVQMKAGKALIEESILRDYIQRYFQQLFPGQILDLEVVLGKGQVVEIISRIPQKEENSEVLFETIRNELGTILAKQLGYEREFILTITD